jgi:hypothetical protein
MMVYYQDSRMPHPLPKLSKTPILAYCEGEVEPKVFATMLNNIKIYWVLDIDLVV